MCELTWNTIGEKESPPGSNWKEVKSKGRSSSCLAEDLTASEGIVGASSHG